MTAAEAGQRILVVDDTEKIVSILRSILRAEGYHVETAVGGEKAMALLDRHAFDLIIADVDMSPVDGFAVLETVREKMPEAQCVLTTAHASVETAVRALRLNVFDYILKPFNVDEMIATATAALEGGGGPAVGAIPLIQVRLDSIVAHSASMQSLCATAARIAGSDTPVLIQGEPGTGRQLLAQALHRNSPRRNEAFEAVDCEQVPAAELGARLFGGSGKDQKGVMAAAHCGTVFLGEVQCLDTESQATLLSVIQDRALRPAGGGPPVPLNVRVIASTRADLKKLATQGEFNPALHSRLSTVPIELKPLRERTEDIIPLFYFFLEQEQGNSGSFVLNEQACRALQSYAWPENARELRDAVQHVVKHAESGEVKPDALPPRIANAAPAPVKTGKGLDVRGRSLREFLKKKAAAPVSAGARPAELEEARAAREALLEAVGRKPAEGK